MSAPPWRREWRSPTRSTSTANPIKAEKEPLTTLLAIREWIKPFHAPVFAFENKARRTPFRTLISVLLSSRTKDETTGPAADRLLQKADSPEKMLKLGGKKIASLIYPVGFYRQKARYIMRLCRQLLQLPTFPQDLESLTALAGVGRKTANLVMALAFARPAVAVDTHVYRISRRLGWSISETPQGVEEDLKKLFPRRKWSAINPVLVGFGQTVCRPLPPRCDRCFLPPRCPYYLSQKSS